jgi:hypothetical protein
VLLLRERNASETLDDSLRIASAAEGDVDLSGIVREASLGGDRSPPLGGDNGAQRSAISRVSVDRNVHF